MSEAGTASTGMVSLPRRLLLGAAGALLLLGVVLAAAVQPLGWRGQTIGLGLYLLIAALVLGGLGYHAPHRRFGLANAVTLLRATAVALLFAILGEEMLGGGLAIGPGLRWLLVAIATASLLLDGVDGWLARRNGLASAFGARFDMETDALMILALSLFVYRAGQAGAFVLTSGLMRYMFVAAAGIWPVLRGPLPPSWWRKAICVAQTALLIVALAPVVPPAAGSLLCLAGLALLVYSFGIDCVRLTLGSVRPADKSHMNDVSRWSKPC